MSQLVRCDGCGIVTDDSQVGPQAHTIRGTRYPANSGGPGHLPMGDFDWCRDCALTAFGAVARRRELAVTS